MPVTKDFSRDSLFTEFGFVTVKDRYLLPGETSPQDMYARVAGLLADDEVHAQRLYDYMSKHWFSPSTPILSNSGGDGMLISCFLSEYGDSMDAIKETWAENVDLAKVGGGTGTYAGNIRSKGEKVGLDGKTSGVIPFLTVQNAISQAVSQGLKRRGSSAAYLPVWHPEIEEFLNIRKPQGGAPERKCLGLHHGVVIDDEFMEAVRNGRSYDLRSPKTDEVIKTVYARTLWANILETRLETGEPYILFIDTTNRALPCHHEKLKLEIRSSNLCCEILLPIGLDHLGFNRCAVCCLSSLNLEKYAEWKGNQEFITDVYRFLDNVLSNFIKNAPPSLRNAVYSASAERSVGLGVMGFHGFLQSKGIPFDSVMAKVWNKQIFKEIRNGADAANELLGKQRGDCPDYQDAFGKDCPKRRRFSYTMAIAPTASISTICGGASPGIDPFTANAVTHKTLSGPFVVKNKYFERILELGGLNTDAVWSEIIANGGSVQFLLGRNGLKQSALDCFKTAHELDQKWVVEHAADRAPEIDQSQSVNLFLPSDVSKAELNLLHFSAWEKGVKSLYYLRSLSGYDAENVAASAPKPNVIAGEENKECLACQ